jgi:hypothetical protein
MVSVKIGKIRINGNIVKVTRRFHEKAADKRPLASWHHVRSTN